MKRLILIAAAALFSLALPAQDKQVEAFLAQAQGHRVTVDYEYVISGMPDIMVEGSAVIQDNCFRMEGAGLLILCDAVNIWTLDLDGKEAYIEAAGKMDYMDYMSELTLEDNGWLSGLYAEPISGNLIPFTIKNIQFLPPSGDMSVFSPDENTFNGDWVITDLR
ncbi:MAG: hypothetical protein J6X77_00450 [Bacteroidales bacterium]|nr:hypothetical protein [Bacteroidales bacterium]